MLLIIVIIARLKFRYMIKQILGVGIVLLVSFSFSACSRCMSCTATDSTGTEVYNQNVCGNSSTIDFFQTNVNSAYPDSAGYTVTCIEVN